MKHVPIAAAAGHAWLLIAALLIPAAAQVTSPSPKGTAPPKAGKEAARPASAPRAASIDLSLGVRVGEPPRVPALPTVERTLPNGLRVVLAESRNVPIVSGWLVVRAGSLYDPPDRLGLSELTVSLLARGGSVEANAARTAAQLRRYGASITSEAGQALATMTFQAPAERAAEVLKLVASAVASPALPVEVFEELEAQMRGQVGARNAEAEAVAEREFLRAAYGASSPYARVIDYEHVQRIEREDILRFQRRHYFPANAMLAIQGDFDAAEMGRAVESLFGGWSNEQAPLATPQQPKSASPRGILWGERSDNKAAFVAGQLIEASDEERAAVDVAGELMAAHVNEWARSRTNVPGSWGLRVTARWERTIRLPRAIVVAGSVEPASATEAVAAVLTRIREFGAARATDAAVEEIKRRILLRLIAEHDRPERILRTSVVQAMEGRGADFLEAYQSAMQAVTAAAVAKVIRERFRSDAYVAAGNGNSRLALRSFEDLGLAARALDLTIPAPKEIEANTDPESLEKGREWLRRVQQAMGGTEKLKAIRDYSISAAGVLYSGARTAAVRTEERWIAESTYRQDQLQPGARLIVFYNGKIGWVSDGQRLGPLSPVMLTRVRGELFRLPFRLALSDQVEGRRVSYQGSGVLYIAGDNSSVRLYVDEETWLPRRIVYLTVGQNGSPLPAEESYEDWRDAGGIKMPYRLTMRSGGAILGTFTASEIKFNSGLSLEEVERKPAPEDSR